MYMYRFTCGGDAVSLSSSPIFFHMLFYSGRSSACVAALQRVKRVKIGMNEL
jgi:hypothetical protein